MPALRVQIPQVRERAAAPSASNSELERFLQEAVDAPDALHARLAEALGVELRSTHERSNEFAYSPSELSNLISRAQKGPVTEPEDELISSMSSIKQEVLLKRRRAAGQKVNWAASKRFQISKLKFRFPRARTYDLIRARSRLYRSQSLQENTRWNTRWKALIEIYTTDSFGPFSNFKFFVGNY